MLANGPGELGSIPRRIKAKTLKMVLDISLLNSQQNKVRIKGKVEQSRKRSSVVPTPQWSSYWKGSLLVALDYDANFTLSYFKLWNKTKKHIISSRVISSQMGVMYTETPYISSHMGSMYIETPV